MHADDDPPDGSGAPHATAAGHVDAAEQLRSLQAVKIERQGFAVVDDADRDIGLRLVRFASSPDDKISISMSGCRRAKSAKSGISRCVARGGASVTRRSPRTLWSRPKTRVSSWCDDASIWLRVEDLLARSRQAVARRQLFEHLRPEAFLELGDASQHGRVVHTRGARRQPAPSLRARRQESSERHPSRSWCSRELDRIELLLKQIKAAEIERDALLAMQKATEAAPAAILLDIKSIGPEVAAILWSEGLLDILTTGAKSLPEPCPPDAGCWCSRPERRPYIRLIVLGDGLRHLNGLDLIAKNHGDELSGANHLTLYLSKSDSEWAP